MTDNRYDVLTIGNAIVDVLAQADDAFLVRKGLAKGTMRLIDAGEAERLYEEMGPGQLVSGGCAGNTAAGLASFGARTAFIGKVASDELGRFFRHDMRSAGIAFATSELDNGMPTARSLILITPDSERTMNTFLGASQELTPDDIDRATVEAAAITYLEGYLWDPPKAKEGFRVASGHAHGAGRQVAITLSDVFCVDRYRQEFLALMKEGAVDIVFANLHEALALYETSDLGTALDLLAEDARLAVVTMSEKGSMVMNGAARIEAPAAPVGDIVDLTGAGDQYAAGFLYGLARGAPLDRCAALGSLAAAEVISHVGARPQHSLADRAAESGLAV